MYCEYTTVCCYTYKLVYFLFYFLEMPYTEAVWDMHGQGTGNPWQLSLMESFKEAYCGFCQTTANL